MKMCSPATLSTMTLKERQTNEWFIVLSLKDIPHVMSFLLSTREEKVSWFDSNIYNKYIEHSIKSISNSINVFYNPILCKMSLTSGSSMMSFKSASVLE